MLRRLFLSIAKFSVPRDGDDSADLYIEVIDEHEQPKTGVRVSIGVSMLPVNGSETQYTNSSGIATFRLWSGAFVEYVYVNSVLCLDDGFYVRPPETEITVVYIRK